MPTVVELGLPQLVAENYFGVSGPAGLPKDVTDKLQRRWPRSWPTRPSSSASRSWASPRSRPARAEFADLVAKQVNDWAPAIKAADLK